MLPSAAEERTHKSYRLIIYGNVQGVGFRIAALKKAQALEIYGYIKNLTDGSIECSIEGTEFRVNEFMKWIRHGPSGAMVLKTDIEKLPIQGYSLFTIEI